MNQINNGEAAAAPAGTRNRLAAVKDALSTPAAGRWLFVVRLLLSFLTLFYMRGVIRAAYESCFYRLEIPADDRLIYCMKNILVCLCYGALMLFTRRQLITRLVIFLSMPFYFPIFLFNYRYPVLVIPFAVMIVVTYLASGAGEGVKTILGAVFLTVYILGAFLFAAVQSILVPATTEVVKERALSPGGNYRYSVVQVDDRADGNTYISLEPVAYDRQGKHETWYAKGYSKVVYQERPLKEDFAVRWETQSRAEITENLLQVNPNLTIALNEEQMDILGLKDTYTQEIALSDMSRKQRLALGYVLEDDLTGEQTAESLGAELKEPTDTVVLTYQKIKELDMEPDCRQRLDALTDEQLARLGVPEQNEVLYVNDKIVFRQYVAVLENTFDESKRSLSAFMEPNVLPEVVPEGMPIPETTTETETTTTRATTTTEETTETTADTTEDSGW